MPLYALRLLLLLFLPWQAAGAAAPVVVLKIDGAITPASSDYLVRGLRGAAAQGAQLVVIEMDTPGGLDTSMRDIIKEILASPVPVASFVHPGGARAASAGTYILYASHVAAMAPGTNLGAATPVAIGIGGQEPEPPVAPEKGAKGEKGAKKKSADEAPAPQGASAMTRKQVNDAAAYIRSLAQLRGRNADWAEKAVREATSLPAREALDMKVIDLIAADLPELLARLDGRKLDLQGQERTLDTAGAVVTRVEQDWRSRLLGVITQPSFALILMMIGIYGLIFEFSNPGAIAPGVIGGICLMLALYAFQLLPVSWAGLGLIVLGIGFMVAEAFAPSFGLLGIGGIVAFVVGAVILIDTDVPGFGIPISLIASLALASALGIFLVVTLALKSRSRPVVSGREDLLGAPGVVTAGEGDERWARVRGEIWRVRSAAPLAPGQRVRVRAREGLVLTVEPDTDSERRTS